LIIIEHGGGSTRKMEENDQVTSFTARGERKNRFARVRQKGELQDAFFVGGEKNKVSAGKLKIQLLFIIEEEACWRD